MSDSTVVTTPKAPMRKRMGLDKANTQKWIFLFIAIVPPFGGYLLLRCFRTFYPFIMRSIGTGSRMQRLSGCPISSPHSKINTCGARLPTT